MQKVVSVTRLDPDLTNNGQDTAGQSREHTKGLPTINPSQHLNLGNHPKAVLFRFPPPLLYKCQYISARQSLTIQGDLSINSSVVVKAE